jgi:glycogen synthase
MRNGMSRDFSWSASAKEYVKVYDRARLLRAAG